MDQIPLAAPLCKYARLVDRPERIPFYVHEAIARATAGRPGPVHLTIPSDVLQAEVKPDAAWTAAAASGAVQPLSAADPGLIDQAADWLASAKRPLIVAGTGAYYARAEQALDDFAAMMQIPVVVPIWDQGTAPRPAPHFFGVIGAFSGGPLLLPDADLVLLVGARIDYRVSFGLAPGLHPEARLVRIDVDPAELTQGRAPDLAILADPASALRALTEAASRRETPPFGAWLAEARRRSDQFRRPWTEAPPPTPPVTGHHVVEAIRPLLGDDLIFLVDGGNIGQWAHMALGDRYPGHWLTCGPSGVVGWGVSGAIAAKLCRPDRPVLLLSGDGAIGFALVELETAVRHDAPFVVVLADDRAWGSVVTGQERTYGEDGVIGSRLGQVDYAKVAEGLGAAGVRVEAASRLGTAIAEALASGRPTLIHVPTAEAAPQGGAAD